MKKNRTAFLCQAAMIAVLYLILTLLSAQFGLASGAIQIRLSEAICILPIFIPAAIPGLAVGCFLANMLTGSVIFDVIFGTIATLLGAIGTRFFCNIRFLRFVCPIVSNTIIVPVVLRYAYHLEEGFWYLVVTVGIGEVISAGILGYFLYRTLLPYKSRIFK